MPVKTARCTATGPGQKRSGAPGGKKSKQKIAERKLKGCSRSPTEKLDGKKLAKTRKEKAKNSGARLGGLLRTALLFSRHPSRSGEHASTLTSTASQVRKPEQKKAASSRDELDDRISKTSQGTRNQSSVSNGMYHDDQSDKLDHSIPSNFNATQSCYIRHSSSSRRDELNQSSPSIVSRKSEMTIGSLSDIVDDFRRELPDHKHSQNTTSHAPSTGRGKLLLESNRAIERKQQLARLRCSQPQSTSLLRTLSPKDAGIMISSTDTPKPSFSKKSKACKTPESCSLKRITTMTRSTEDKCASDPGAPARSQSMVVTTKPPAQSCFEENIRLSSNDSLSRTIYISSIPGSQSLGPMNESAHKLNKSSSNKFCDTGRSPRSLSPSCRFGPLFLPVDENSLPWHKAIRNHEWEKIESMLKAYDYKLYKERNVELSGNKVRTNRNKSKQLAHSRKPQFASDFVERQLIPVSPLLQVDCNDQAPLHLACSEHMPQKLLQRLLFVERKAGSLKDNDGRYALHIALINSLDTHVIDRLIRCHPQSLGTPDRLKHTPIQYAILKAEFLRDEGFQGDWSVPMTISHEYWQRKQENAWENVDFILATMIARRKSLSLLQEHTVLLDAARFLAPPKVVDKLVTVADRLLLNNGEMSKHVLTLVLHNQYPVYLLKRVMDVASKALPSESVNCVVQQYLSNHFKRGSTFVPRQTVKGLTIYSFVKETVEHFHSKRAGRLVPLSDACNEWWEKLRFLISCSSCRFNDVTEDFILYNALCNPRSPPSLIEYLCRLLPWTVYNIDVETGALPLHLACRFWDPVAVGVQNQPDYASTLNLLTVGDACLARRRWQNRLPLHHSLLSGKPPPFIRKLLTMDEAALRAVDPLTRLFPFQLAALKTKNVSFSAQDTQQVSLVYELLRSDPSCMSTLIGNLNNEMSPLTRHVLQWCYDFGPSGWKLNCERKDMLRSAIRRGKIFVPMKPWWSWLKTMIWRACNDLVDEDGLNPMRETPQTRDYLLHAALWNSIIVPPIVIELIMELYPSSVFIIQPGTGLLPLQIAVQSRSYRPFPFESTIAMSSALEMIAFLDKDALCTKFNDGRLPLHQAIESGKTWMELRPIIENAPADTVSVVDPSTGLLPFQAAACRSFFLPKRFLIGSLCDFEKQWIDSCPKEKSTMLKRVYGQYDLDKLTTIFKVLRASPSVLDPK